MAELTHPTGRGLLEQLDPELVAKIRPVTLAGERTLPVPDVLTSLFPWGGIQRGTSLAVAGIGSWSLAMAVAAEALGAEGWLAVVGVPDLNLVAAADLGLRLDRVLMVEDPGPGRWATVVATLLESVEIVAVAPTQRVGSIDRRRLAARVREQESVLLHLDGGRHWPSVVDLTLTTDVEQWDGIGQGHGRLQARRVRVGATARRGGSDGADGVSVWLPGPDGRLGAAASRRVEGRSWQFVG